jgi:TctA family transporter
MFVPLTALWLPILLSAIFVFIASSILWMLLPFWHQRDYGRIADDKPIVSALTAVASGLYVVPWMDWKNATPEQQAEMQKGPAAFLTVRNPSAFSFPRTLSFYFLYILVAVVFAAYITSRTRAAGAEYLEVFRVAGTAGFLIFGLRGFPDSIWYGKPWKVTFKEAIDGVIYGLLMGGTFGWLWPK